MLIIASMRKRDVRKYFGQNKSPALHSVPSSLTAPEAPLPALGNNIENRVRKLPKPSNAAQGLQPLFEAISNAMFALEDRLGSDVANGRIDIQVTNLSSPDDIEILVSDNGIGLDARRYSAFCEIDTDFKQARGGKGVGRLFWLDAFSYIHVESTYAEADIINRRAFNFVLNNHEQVVPQHQNAQADGVDCGTTITFRGLRKNDYADHFPRRSDTFLRYFSAHFIADFLVGSGPRLFIDLDGDITEYPKAVVDLSVGKALEATFQHKEYGTLTILGYTCQAGASTGLEGRHQLHLLANGRTVETRKVDKLLGVSNLERDEQKELVFHGCISGEYLDC